MRRMRAVFLPFYQVVGHLRGDGPVLNSQYLILLTQD